MDNHKVWFSLVLVICSHLQLQPLNAERRKKSCQGTDNQASYSISNSLPQLYQRYKGCAIVEGNLELVFLTNSSHLYNLNFLEDIEEVTGYVLITMVYARIIPLLKLRIIRGRNLFQPGQEGNGGGFSLYVAFNYEKGNENKGLEELRLTSLTEISTGNVLFHSNELLCFVDTIEWFDIFSDKSSTVIFKGGNDLHPQKCPKCHHSCKSTNQTYHCWGGGRDKCQKFTKTTCPPACKNRCLGDVCCDEECSAGCTGPKNSQCHACKNFEDEGKCVANCPLENIYDPQSKTFIKNVNFKYASDNQCVFECPGHLLYDRGACVVKCEEGYTVNSTTRKCMLCDGQCPKTCPGISNGDWLNAANIDSFVNCTSVEGSIKITSLTFQGDLERLIPPLQVSQLSALKQVTEVFEFVLVNADNKDLTNLEFLSNLRIIHGRHTSSDSLSIYYTDLKFLGLSGLREIKNGGVYISNNAKLCLIESMNWTSIVSSGARVNIKANRKQELCNNEGIICSDQCKPTLGCMGPGPDECIACRWVQYQRTCLPSCEVQKMYQVNEKLCALCHEECAEGCNGPGESDCIGACKNVIFENSCFSSCPQQVSYQEGNRCLPCDPICVGGCTGPESTLGMGGCNSCIAGIQREREAVRCLNFSGDLISCPNHYYLDRGYKNLQGVCKPCDSECLECHGPGHCLRCRHLVEANRCVAQCSNSTYLETAVQDVEQGMEKDKYSAVQEVEQGMEKDKYNGDLSYGRGVPGTRCRPCHPECLGCVGPTMTDCLRCKHYILETNERFANVETYNCTRFCPPHAAYKLIVESDTYCIPDIHAKRNMMIIGGTIVFVVFMILFVTIFCWCRITKQKERLKSMTPAIHCEPLIAGTMSPDMAQLRLITNAELRYDTIIGTGAFGTVYKGYWLPSGERLKIPVAIKVLRDSCERKQDLLEEARMMASIVHPHCVQMLAICLANDIALITQLMPLGCLLGYVRRNKKNIGSKLLLNWSMQIAKGMAYLEQRGVVHRDLAARNVLVQTIEHVKIIDFGLAKFTDSKEQFESVGGKLPIKWLAIESIKSRVFSYKSDVWSFGVTIWEMYTYGQRPYESVPPTQMLQLLEKGERLVQPPICTIDAYMVMVKCWMVDPVCRPSFLELVEEFAKMVRDPGRYLVIQKDELMRVPSQVPDQLELLRNMSMGSDGPEELVLADEYVKKRSRLAQLKHEELSISSKSKSPPKTRATFQIGELSLSSSESLTSHILPLPSTHPSHQIHADNHHSENGSTTPHYLEPKRPIRRVPVDVAGYLKLQDHNPISYLELLEHDHSDTSTNSRDDSRSPKDDYLEAPNTCSTLISPMENAEYFLKPNSTFEETSDDRAPLSI